MVVQLLTCLQEFEEEEEEKEEEEEEEEEDEEKEEEEEEKHGQTGKNIFGYNIHIWCSFTEIFDTI